MASNRAFDRAFVGAAAYLSVLATIGPCALAQEKAAATPAKAPADGARATATMERARAAYTALKAYRETATFKYAVEVEGGDEPPEMSVTTEISAAPGHKMRLTSDQIEIISDGTKAWIVSPARKQYIEQAIEGDMSPQEMAQVLPEAGYAIPPTAQILWRADKPLALLTHQVTKVTDAKAETRGGVAGTRVTGEGMWEGNEDAVVKVSLWFNDKTGLLGEYVVDLTDMIKKQYAEMGAAGDDDEAPPKIKSALYTHTFDNVKVDAAAGDLTFAYKAPEDFKKVDEFKEMRGPGAGDQMALLGKPAPQISGKTLDEKEFSLEGLKGKVVMLDFWATWCGPCVAAIPHIQTLSEKYADKGVVVIGINQDQGNKATVKKFLEKKKITIRQYMDDGSVGQKYGVTGIPCMVLLDKKGNVQEIKVGYGEGEEDELAKDLDLLLEGKDIHSAEEIAQLQKEAAEGGDDDNAPAPVMGGKREANPLADVNPERLESKEVVRTQAYFYGANSRRVDVDGDGKLELVAPGMMGGLDILSADASSVKHVQFEGQAPMSSMSAFEPVTIGGVLHWLTAASSYSRGGGISIGLYKADGTKVWTYSPQGSDKLVGQICLAVGDLDGDSRPEVAAGISLMKMDMSGRGRSGPTMCGSSVVVLDLEGKELVRRDLKGQVSMVSIGTPAKAGDAPSLTCFVDGKLTRFTYKKDAKPQAAASEKP